MKTFIEIINQIGEELGIKVTHLVDNWLTILEKDGQIHYITGYKFDLNNHGIGNIMDDKGLFHDLLVLKKLPVIEQKNIYKKYDVTKVLDYFYEHNHHLIVKGNMGTCGNCVYLINDGHELLEKLDYLLGLQDSISISPYYDIENEYRVIILNNEARVVYGKIKPVVIGDGIHTIGELSSDFNSYFLKHKPSNSEYIPREDEHVEIDFRFNLSNGAILFTNIETNLKKQIVDLALEVASKCQIIFGSIDIIYTKNHQLLVLEANSGVMMNNYIKLCPNGYNDAYNVFYDAIALMFQNKG